jgi:hypothetical protein
MTKEHNVKLHHGQDEEKRAEQNGKGKKRGAEREGEKRLLHRNKMAG